MIKKYRRTIRIAKKYYELGEFARTNGWDCLHQIRFYNKSTKYYGLCSLALQKWTIVILVINVILQAITFILKIINP